MRAVPDEHRPGAGLCANHRGVPGMGGGVPVKLREAIDAYRFDAVRYSRPAFRRGPRSSSSFSAGTKLKRAGVRTHCRFDEQPCGVDFAAEMNSFRFTVGDFHQTRSARIGIRAAVVGYSPGDGCVLPGMGYQYDSFHAVRVGGGLPN